MDVLQKLIPWVGGLSTAPKILLSLVVIAIAGFALAVLWVPQKSQADVSELNDAAKIDQQVFLRIKPIKLFPDNPDTEVQLSIWVNGTQYKHPSVAGVEWMKVGPAMSDKIIELPPASRYDVSISMRLRDGSVMQSRDAGSQRVTPVKALPYSEDYNLYPISFGIRDAAVSAVVPYEVYRQ